MPLGRGVGSSQADVPFFVLGVGMTTEQHRLTSLGWRALDEGHGEDGRYRVVAHSCGHYVMSVADTREKAWAAACSLALKITCGGLRLPRP